MKTWAGGSACRPGSVVMVLAGVAGSLLCASAALGQALPQPPVPPQNPITEAKRVLGKILFWDEQLSSDNTTACGSCHVPANGGGDPLPARNAGIDGVLNTPDDILGSLGLVRTDASDTYMLDAVYRLNPQVTSRSANSMINAAFAPQLFWDGRATSQFTHPQSGQVLIPVGGALESQSVIPTVSSIEMAHANRNWDEVAGKLRTAGPLALATNIPADVASVIASFPSYPELFEQAFGSRDIDAGRIAFAIATYERTLISDQSPWDRFQRGEQNAMTQGQIAGWNTFRTSECAICHAPPLFSDNTFRNIALRPNNQDLGRGAITNNPNDNGRFKVASLRNLAGRVNLMHTGQFTNMGQVFTFYAGPGAPNVPNRDPILPTPIPPQAQNAVGDFIINALTDPRVRSEQFPFDRPRLHSESNPANPGQLGNGTAGTGGQIPRMVSDIPPNVGNTGFKIGLGQALPGTQAYVLISNQPPVNGVLTPTQIAGPFSVTGAGVGNGVATFKWPIAPNPSLDGKTVWMQWQVQDAGAVGGVALSRIAEIRIFGGGSLPFPCQGDTNFDASINAADLSVLLSTFGQQMPWGSGGDLNADGVVDSADLSVLLGRFGSGC